MHKKFKKGDRLTIKQKIREKNKLIIPFIKKYKKPILVHSTPDHYSFKRIITKGKLKVPKDNENMEHLFIERLLGLYPSIFFSLGFVYSVSYDFKYSLIFDLDLLKQANYYKRSLGFQCYREAFRYWEKNDSKYVEILSRKNKSCREVVNKYYHNKHNGKKRTGFEFWKIEKDLIELINGYDKKRDLIKMFKRLMKELYITYTKSIKIAKKVFLEEYAPETISKNDIYLLNNRQFLGFYIKGHIPVDIKLLLKKNYPDKIFFDGQIIRLISDLS